MGRSIPNFKRRNKYPVRTAGQEASKIGFSKGQGQGAKVIPIQGEDIEGIKLHLLVMVPGVQGDEIRNTIHAQNHGFTVNDELPVSVL